MKVKVTRAFMLSGKRQEVGSTLELPDRQARELISLGKAEAIGVVPAQAGPMTTETTAVLVKGKAKENPHAGQ